MSERWIVGTDGSDGSQAALLWAVRHSAGRLARLDPVRAEPRAPGNRFLAAITRRWRRGSDEQLDSGSDPDVSPRVVHGPAGPVLVEAASGASLMVIGRHGAGGGWRNALGSVSRYCVTHAAVPTVVVPPGWVDGGRGRIVVGFDGSANARAALDWAVGFADDDTDIRALIAIEVAPWLQEDIVHVRLGEELEAEQERLLGLLAAADPDGRATADLVVRGAKSALARAAESTDLIAVGARGSGVMAGLGSVSTWLVDASPCPIAVVPDPAEH
jgi:nucleotide-binding universal stress UspA family protein